MIKVSVIIPVSDINVNFSECLVSICRQTLKDIEIICVVMDSKTETSSLLHRFLGNDPRIKVFYGKNKEISSCYNYALSVAKGRYVAFMNANDWITPDFMEGLYKSAIEYGADIACASFLSIDEKGENIPEIKYGKIQRANSLTQKFKLLKMPEKNCLFNKIFRKKLIVDQQINFNGEEDYSKVMWLSEYVKVCDEVVAVPKVYYYHRLKENVSIDKTAIKLARQAQIKMMVDHKVKVKIPYSKKTKIRFLGIPFIKILDNPSYRRYYFCGMKIFEVTSVKKF